MEILQQILIWLFGILSAIFLILALVSLFLHGSSLFRVSDKANRIFHFYVLLGAICFAFWFMAYSPEFLLEGLICLLPMMLLAVGLSYGMSLFGRNLLKRASKRGFEYPFKDKEQ
ncbi:MAG TPA: hypothetical protein VJ821_15295 [Anaerolineales bacterium]|nr:hypothetical protein [Anaerolineales bacterium]